MANITGKTISELPLLSGFTNDTLFPVELSGSTYHIPYSSITNYENIIYSDLYNKVVNGLLETGKWYRLTDYKSVNFLNGWEIANNNPTPIDPSFNPREIYTGDTEVLLLQATSPYDISEIGYSETFNGDIIQYQPYTNKIGVDLNIGNGYTLPDSSIVSGFDLQWDGTNVYFEMPSGYPALFGHYFYLYAEFDGGSYYQDGCFEPLTPGISICQYPYTSSDPYNGYLKGMSRLRIENDGTKVVMIDLDYNDFLNYDVDSLYVNTVYAIGDAYGWITRRNDTYRNINVPFDFRGRKYRRYEVDLTPANPALGIGFYGQGDNYLGYGTTGNYRDFYSFSKDYYDIYDVMWEGIGGADQSWYAGYSDNNVFFNSLFRTSLNDYSYNNTFGYCNTNNIGYGFFNNVIIASYLNNIGRFFSSNLVGYSFDSNNIGENVFNNKIQNNFSSNNIGHSFYSNVISSNFTQNITSSNFINNIIGSDFSVNKIECNFNSNTIGNLFYQNYVGNNFSGNQVGSECKFNNFNESFANNNLTPNFFQRNVFSYSVNGIDFSSATHVYNDYTCEVFKNSGGSLRLSYYDNFDVLNITNINS